MKKSATFLTLFLILFSLSLTLAADNDTLSTSDDNSDSEKLQSGFDCLEDKADDCSGLTTQEVALTILATPDNIFDDCVNELETRESSDNWGNIRDTALAILALNHAGEDTEDYEDWLLEKSQTPADLVWFLQEDSNTETECHIGYSSEDYTITVGDNKKINSNAGSCLSLAQLNFWLQISSDCYDQDFQIECDQDFIANLLYKNSGSQTIYVLDQTASAPAYDSIELSVKSKCFGENSCEYEATAWATLALLKTGHNIEEYIPYIIASSETNKRYLPEAFIYILTNYEDYASSLVEEQKLGNYWEATSTSYNRYYDTSLALIALGSSSSEQITKAKDWLYFSQGSNGCWQNSPKETAIVLWALAGRSGRSSSSSSSITYCTQTDYFCIPSTECPSAEDVGDNYFCSSLSDTCCMSENLKTCSEHGGEICSDSEVCTGNERRSSDTNYCCTGSCKERPQENECEAEYYSCADSCSESQESVSEYSCDSGEVCCKTKSKDPDTGSNLWIWILIILILAVLGAIAYIKREDLKLYWFQLKTKFKKDDGKGKGPMSPKGPGFPPRSSMPPRPGFPPVRRQPQRAPPRKRSYDRRDKAISDTFKKLQDMSK